MSKIIDLSVSKDILTFITLIKHPIVLVGGCFDILHVGHVRFLTEAKKEGETLIVLLESNRKVKQLKGDKRPHFSQDERALVLLSLRMVDWVIKLPYFKSDADYQNLIGKLKPDVIAFTQNDTMAQKKIDQSNKFNAHIRVVPYIKTLSTSSISKLLGVE